MKDEANNLVDPAAAALLHFVRKSKVTFESMSPWEKQFLSGYVVRENPSSTVDPPEPKNQPVQQQQS